MTQRRRGSKLQSFFSRRFVMTRSHKFYGLMRNYSLFAIHNSQNDRIWNKSKDSVVEQLSEGKPKLRHLCGQRLKSTGLKNTLLFIDGGVKMNKNVYLNS